MLECCKKNFLANLMISDLKKTVQHQIWMMFLAIIPIWHRVMLNLITVVGWIMLNLVMIFPAFTMKYPNKKTLDKLSKLASQFSRTVDELRKKIPGSSDTSVLSDSLSGFSPPRIWARNAPEIIPSTQEDDDEFELDSVSSSRFNRKRFLAPWRTIVVKTRPEHSQDRVTHPNLA